MVCTDGCCRDESSINVLDFMRLGDIGVLSSSDGGSLSKFLGVS